MSERNETWNEAEVLREAGWLRGLARSLTRDPHLADDLVQNTWLAALRGGAAATVHRGWLRGVMRNLLGTEQRSAGRRSERMRHAAGPGAQGAADDLPADELPADELVARIEMQERLAREVARLDEPYRTAIALRYFEGLPPRKIASRLGLDVRAVETRLRRGLEQLRGRLDTVHAGRREAWFGLLAAIGAVGGPGWKPAAAAAAAVVLLTSAVGVGYAAWPALSAVTATESAPSTLTTPAPELGAPPTGPAAGASARAAARQDERRVAAGSSRERSLLLVREGDERPLAGAPLAVRPAGGESFELSTDEQGLAGFRWAPEWTAVELWVGATDATVEARIPLEDAEEQIVRVARRGGSIAGRVVDLEGRPIPFAEVRAWSTYGPRRTFDWDRPARLVRADADGSFQLEDLGAASGRGAISYTLLAHAPGWMSVHTVRGAIKPSSSVHGCVLVVGPEMEVRGRVSAWDRAGVPGAPMIAYTRESRESKARLRAVQELLRREAQKPWSKPGPLPSLAFASAADGTFALPLTPAAWHLQVDHPDYPRWMDWLEDDAFLDIRLQSGVVLTGRVLDSAGAPVPAARVSLMCRDGREPVETGADGAFEFSSLTPMEGAVLHVTAAGHALRVEIVNLVSGLNRNDLQLEPGCVLAGRVVDSEGEPVANKVVELKGDRLVGSAWLPRHRGNSWEQITGPTRVGTDREGRFRVEGLYEGRFRLRVVENYRTVEAWTTADAGREDVELVIGDCSGSVTIRGRAACADGALPEGLVVRAEPYVEGEQRPAQHYAMVSPDDSSGGGEGEFELAGLDPGLWRLSAWTKGSEVFSWTGEIERFAPGVHVVNPLLLPLKGALKR